MTPTWAEKRLFLDVPLLDSTPLKIKWVHVVRVNGYFYFLQN